MTDPVAIEMTERAVLFAATQDQNMRVILAMEANVDWFLSVDHRRLFLALKWCVDTQQHVDSLTILRAARRNEKASFGDVILEAAWLIDGLREVKGMTIATFTDQHLPELRTSYLARRLHGFLQAGTEKLMDQDPHEVVAWMHSELSAISSAGKSFVAKRVADALLDRYSTDPESAEASRTLGPFTRIPWLDSIGFRLRPKEHVTLAMKPGHGKTTLSQAMAIGASTQVGVAVFPIEDGEDSWLDRYAIMTQGRTIEDLRSLYENHAAHGDFTAYCYKIKDRPLYVAHKSIGMTSYDVLAMVQQLKANDETLGVVFIDQVFCLGDYDRREHKGETQTNAITRTVMRLSRALSKMDICLVMLQHVAKDIAGEPSVKDISDSYVFERFSRKIILGHRPGYDDEANDTAIVLNVAKWTMGKMQKKQLNFNGRIFQIDGFVDPALQSMYPEPMQFDHGDIEYI